MANKGEKIKIKEVLLYCILDHMSYFWPVIICFSMGLGSALNLYKQADFARLGASQFFLQRLLLKRLNAWDKNYEDNKRECTLP